MSKIPIKLITLQDKEDVLLKYKHYNIDNLLILDGVLTNSKDNRFDHAIAKAVYNVPLRDGEVGCTLAHYLAYKEIVLANEPWAIILEDDAIIEKPFNSIIDALDNANFFSEGARVLLLGHSRIVKKWLWWQRLKEPFDIVYNVNGIKLGRSKSISGCGTLSYAINREAAKLMTSYVKPFWRADDWEKISNAGIEVWHLWFPTVWEDLKERGSFTGNSMNIAHVLSIKSFFREMILLAYNRYKRLLK